MGHGPCSPIRANRSRLRTASGRHSARRIGSASCKDRVSKRRSPAGSRRRSKRRRRPTSCCSQSARVPTCRERRSRAPRSSCPPRSKRSPKRSRKPANQSSCCCARPCARVAKRRAQRERDLGHMVSRLRDRTRRRRRAVRSSNPSGRLPVSFPIDSGQEPFYYNHRSTGRPYMHGGDAAFKARYREVPNEPLYPFGYGLSYSSFAYGPVKLSSATVPWNGSITVSARITNTSRRAGEEVVQLYVHDRVASVTRPVRELKAFGKSRSTPAKARREFRDHPPGPRVRRPGLAVARGTRRIRRLGGAVVGGRRSRVFHARRIGRRCRPLASFPRRWSGERDRVALVLRASSPSQRATTAVAMLLPTTFVAERPMSRK